MCCPKTVTHVVSPCLSAACRFCAAVAPAPAVPKSVKRLALILSNNTHCEQGVDESPSEFVPACHVRPLRTPPSLPPLFMNYFDAFKQHGDTIWNSAGILLSHGEIMEGQEIPALLKEVTV